jgi:hypothetical protein
LPHRSTPDDERQTRKGDQNTPTQTHGKVDNKPHKKNPRNTRTDLEEQNTPKASPHVRRHVLVYEASAVLSIMGIDGTEKNTGEKNIHA